VGKWWAVVDDEYQAVCFAHDALLPPIGNVNRNVAPFHCAQTPKFRVIQRQLSAVVNAALAASSRNVST
jgi:hypothetical protein